MFGFLLVRFDTDVDGSGYFSGGGRIVEKSLGTRFYNSPASFKPAMRLGELTHVCWEGLMFGKFYFNIHERARE